MSDPIESPLRTEPRAAPPRPSSARSPAASSSRRWAWSCSRSVGLTLVTRPIAPGPGTATPLPAATPFLVGAPIEGLRPGNQAPELAVTHDDGTAVPAPGPRRQPGPARGPQGQARVAQLLGVVVPAVPGRDAGPARPRRGVRRQGPRDRRRRGPGDDRRQRPGVRRALPAGLPDRVRHLGRHLPTCTGSTRCRRSSSSGRTGRSSTSSTAR